MTMQVFPEGEDEDVKFWHGLRVAATKICIIAADYRGLVGLLDTASMGRQPCVSQEALSLDGLFCYGH